MYSPLRSQAVDASQLATDVHSSRQAQHTRALAHLASGMWELLDALLRMVCFSSASSADINCRTDVGAHFMVTM